MPSLCRELADSQAALAQAVAAQAQERIAELEARLRQLVIEAISQGYAAATRSRWLTGPAVTAPRP